MEITNNSAPRTTLQVDVVFRKNYAREEAQGTLKNISLSGAFLKHAEGCLEPGEKVTLNFVVSGLSRQVHAMVIWTNTKGSGIKFLPTNKRDVQIVDDLIALVQDKKSGSRDVLESIFKKVA